MTIKLRNKACIGIKQFYLVNLPYIKVDSDKSSKNHQSPEASTYEKVPGESISLFQISVNHNLLRKDTKIEMTLNNGFCEMTGNEMLAVDGGDPARNAMVAANRNSGGIRATEAERKMATSYTLGLISLAAGGLYAPAGAVVGAIGLLYSCY